MMMRSQLGAISRFLRGLQNQRTPYAATQDEIAEQLERIFRSDALRRSDRLRAFLRYICDLTARGEADRINEYLLATEVFNRPSSFASNADSTVRSQAHILREKLDQYYRTEGRLDTLRIEVPRGHYVPVFNRRSRGFGNFQFGQFSRAAEKPAFRLGGLIVGAAIAAFLLGRFSAYDVVDSSRFRTVETDSAIAEFWGPWFQNPKGAVLCFSNPLTAVIKHYAEPRGGDLVNPSLRVSDREEATIRRVFELPTDGHIYLTPNRSQIKKGEGLAAVLLAQLFAAQGSPLRITESDSLTWDDLRDSNTILFGNGDTNAWLDPLLESYPFRLRSHEGDTPRSIVVTEPGASEPHSYATEYPSFLNERRLDYALVSMLPGLRGGGRLLLVNGLNHFATRAAVEYLTTPKDLASMLDYLRAASGREQAPWFFQLVLEVEVREGVPTRYQPSALRLIEPRDPDARFFSARR